MLSAILLNAYIVVGYVHTLLQSLRMCILVYVCIHMYLSNDMAALYLCDSLLDVVLIAMLIYSCYMTECSFSRVMDLYTCRCRFP